MRFPSHADLHLLLVHEPAVGRHRDDRDRHVTGEVCYEEEYDVPGADAEVFASDGHRDVQCGAQSCAREQAEQAFGLRHWHGVVLNCASR